MKYIIVDIKDGDRFTSEFVSLADAEKEFKKQWNMLSDSGKKRRDAFYLLESVNPDPESANHFDGNVIKEYK